MEVSNEGKGSGFKEGEEEEVRQWSQCLCTVGAAVNCLISQCTQDPREIRTSGETALAGIHLIVEDHSAQFCFARF